MRLNSNVRKRWPIISKTNKVPFKFNGIQLKTKEEEIGEAKCVRASVFVPDYLSKYGDGTEIEIAKALIKPELDKVDRFLHIMHTDVQYNEFHPYRKRTKIEPTIEDVAPASVNATIAMAFLPNFITPEYFRASNALAVRELKNQLRPLLKLKTTSDIIHQARKLIATKTKWVPSIVDINPRLAEILHYVCGPYHLLSVGNLGELNQMSYERLFQDIVKVCLNSGDPLGSFRSSLDSIHIFETPLREQVFHVPGARPFTLIAKAIVGAPIDVESRVRETRFVVVDSVGNMKQSALLCGMGQAQYVHQYKWWEGKETVFFENGFIKGYVNKEDRRIVSVELNSLPLMTNLRPVLLDLMFYCRAAETGFDIDFPLYIIEERRKRYFFEYHEKHPQDLFKAFGVSTKGIVSLDCYYGEPSSGYLEKVSVCASTVQPYSIKSWDYRVGKDLTVYKKMGNREIEVQDIAEVEFNMRAPYPNGVSFSELEHFNLYTSSIVRFSKVTENLLTNTKALKRYLDDMGTGNLAEKRLKLFKVTVETNKYSMGAMKRIREEDWSDLEAQPAKRIKGIYLLNLAANPETRPGRSMAVPKRIRLANSNQYISENGESGVVTFNGKAIKVFEKKLCPKM
ncbi:hypothetical protein JTE90_018182 [Oedothorax gibbosus]|nr:hypothetical protein JTE90_018182 [Oedothorax gibbosus]